MRFVGYTLEESTVNAGILPVVAALLGTIQRYDFVRASTGGLCIVHKMRRKPLLEAGVKCKQWCTAMAGGQDAGVPALSARAPLIPGQFETSCFSASLPTEKNSVSPE